METLSIRTGRRTEIVDITAQVRRAVEASGVRDGMCLVNCPHTTAGIAIQEHADPAVARDLAERLEHLAPHGAPWRHAEGNADSHVKSALVGPGQVLPVSGGHLVLGTWQGVFFCEFDGPRRDRRVIVTVLADAA